MHLTFSRSATAVVSEKTPNGKTYREIERDLLEPLPAEWHEIKKLGFSKDLNINTYYGFCPWWRLRERLRQIVGSGGFRFEVVETYLSSDGDPVTVGILNILGVEHQGIGYGRSHGSYKGGKEEIAWADAFKNAAEQHGLGAYLDDQRALVLHLLAAKHPEAKAIADILKVQFIKSRAITAHDLKKARGQVDESPSPSPSQPQDKPQPTAIAVKPKTVVAPPPPDRHYLYPQHNVQTKAIRELLGMSAEEVLKESFGKHPGDLPLEDYEDLICRLALNWGIQSRIFPSFNAAKEDFNTEYEHQCEQQQRDISIYDAVHNWVVGLRESMKNG